MAPGSMRRLATDSETESDWLVTGVVDDRGVRWARHRAVFQFAAVFHWPDGCRPRSAGPVHYAVPPGSLSIVKLLWA